MIIENALFTFSTGKKTGWIKRGGQKADYGIW